jgi:flavin-dependent thymidylate synthase
MKDEVYRLLDDAPFNKHSMNVGKKTSPFNHGKNDVGVNGIQVKLVQGIDEWSFRRTTSKAVRATIGIDPDEDQTEADWEEMLKGGLQTALETQTVVFEVAGVSRTCTHQLVRSRRASFHQQSQRASFMGAMPNVRMPLSVVQNPEARKAFLEAVYAARKAYRIATDQDIAYQDARFILPEGTETYILCEYPLREFMAAYSYRACSMFQWEIMYVFRKMKEVLVVAHPWLEDYIKITCEKTHVCEFQGWERVEGHCPFPWAKEDNRRYNPPSGLKIEKKS